MRLTSLAIDPGKAGGVAYRDEFGVIHTWPLEYKDSDVDVYELFRRLMYLEPQVIIIEQQTIYRGQGAKSSGTTMRNYGKLLATAEVYRRHNNQDCVLILPTPKMWQKVIIPNAKRGETKSASIAYCQYRHPEVSLLRNSRCRTPSDGISDAICMLDWAHNERLTIVT